jgi:hypothetical protein
MDRVPDAGAVWRKRIRKQLFDLGILWLDPTRKPINIGVEDDESRRLRRVAKEAGDYDTVADEMTPIRDVDRRMVNVSDFLIVNIDVEVHACGTYDEMSLANDQDKPILVHVEQGKVECPDWLFACIPHEHIFDTWIDLRKYVRHVAHADVVDHMGRWLFFDWTGDQE